MLHQPDGKQSLLTNTLLQYSKVFSRVSVVSCASDQGIINIIKGLGMRHIGSLNADQGLRQSLIA